MLGEFAVLETKHFDIPFEYDVNGAELSSMEVGGTVRRVCRPATAEELCAVIAELSAADEKFAVLGKGSNVIFSDRGYDGTVVLTTGLKGIFPTDTGYVAEAGVMLSALSLRAAKDGFGGLEFAYGIPGTVGGGVYMNAGAYGGEMKDVLSKILCVDKQGNKKEYSPKQARLSYRHSAFMKNGLYIVAAEFVLPRAESKSVLALMEENMHKRKTKQPLEYPSCGSTFKRPAGHFAGALIEQSGLRGFSVGGAQVSEKHCGFVINRGGATASQIIELIKHVQKTVFEKTGVKLETEVEIY